MKWLASCSLFINKKYFWKASKTPARFLFTTATFAILSVVFIERNKINQQVVDFQTKIIASEKVQNAFEIIHKARINLGVKIDPNLDPQELGLVGVVSSILTSKPGNLSAKQTTINPNWASVFIEMFREAHLKAGDLVAAGMSGSFPALNISFLIAAETYGLKSIVVSSVTSSSFGANIPGLSWLEMEGLLFRSDLIHIRSKAVSIGAKGDLGLNLPGEGITKVNQIIAKEGIPQLIGNKKSELIQERLDIFQNPKNGGPVKAYINIGGGVASVGSAKIKKTFQTGVTIHDSSEHSTNNTNTEKDLELGVMTYFKSENIPVINIVNIKKLANKYQLPIAPKQKPEVGKGILYYSNYYFGPVLFGFLMALIILLIWQAKQVKKILKLQS